MAEELSGQFEGDIVITPEELDELLSGRGGRTGLINERYRWPDNIVPYEIWGENFSETLNDLMFWECDNEVLCFHSNCTN